MWDLKSDKGAGCGVGSFLVIGKGAQFYRGLFLFTRVRILGTIRYTSYEGRRYAFWYPFIYSAPDG